MGTENSQPPVIGIGQHPGHDGRGIHVDATTIALLAEIDLEMGADDVLSGASVEGVRDLARDLLADDPDIELDWRETGLVQAASHIATCSFCSMRHRSVAQLSATELHAPATKITVDPARMELAVEAALTVFDAETPVSHARSDLVHATGTTATTKRPEAVKPPWWQKLFGSNASTSGGSASGRSSDTSPAISFQRGVLIAGVGVFVVVSAIVLRPGQVQQVSTVAIPKPTVDRKVDSKSAKAPGQASAGAATKGGADTSVAGFIGDRNAQDTETTSAAAADTVASESANTAAGGATDDAAGASPVAAGAVSSPPGGSSDQLDASPATEPPPTTITSITSPAGQQETVAKKASSVTTADVTATGAPSVTAKVPTKSTQKATTKAAQATTVDPGQVTPAAPLTTIAANALPSPVQSPPSAPAPTDSPSSARTRAVVDGAPVVIQALGDTASNDDLLARFTQVITDDPVLRTKIFSSPTTGTANTTANPPSSIATSTVSTTTVLSGAAVAVSTAAPLCPPPVNQQVLATGSGTVNGRLLLVRIVRTLPGSGSGESATFTEIVDPGTCVVLARQPVQ